MLSSTVLRKRRDAFFRSLTLVYLLFMALVMLALPWVLRPWMRQPFIGALVEKTLVVGALSAPQYAAGNTLPLQVNDVLLSLDGHHLRDGVHLNRLLRRHRVGETVTLEVRQPDGTRGQVRVILRRFSWRDQWTYFYAFYLVGILFFVVGGWVYLFRRHDTVGRELVTFSASAGFTLAGFLDVWATYRLLPIWLLALGMSGAALFNVGALFPRPWRWVKQKHWLVGLPHLLGGVLLLNVALHLQDVDNPWGYIHAREGLYIFDALIALMFLGRMLYVRFRSPFPAAQAQAAFIAAGFLLGFGPLVLWMLSLPWKVVPFSPWLVAPTVVFPLALTYAFVRYRVARTDWIARRTLTYTLMATFTAVGYGLLVTGLTLALGARWSRQGPLFLGLVAFALALAFDPARRFIQQRIDRLFARRQLAYEARLNAFGQALVEAPDINAIARLTRETLEEALSPQPFHIFLFDATVGRYRAYPDAHGQPTTDLTFAADSPLARFLEKQQSPYFLHQEDPPPDLAPVLPRLQVLDAVLFIPLPGRKRLVGFLALGARAKASYDGSAITFLENLARQAALAIARAQTVDALERRMEQMNTLVRTAQGVNFTVQFDDLLELLYAQTTRLVPAKYFQILLWDETAQTLRYVFVVEGESRNTLLEGRILPEGSSLVWAVWQNRRALHTDDYPVTCRREGFVVDLPDALAWMGIPLNTGAETIGVMVLAHASVDVAYTEEQVALVHAVADLAAGAMVKARLLDETRRHAAHLAALNQALRRLTATLDLEALTAWAARSALSLTDARAAALFLYEEADGLLRVAAVAGDAPSEAAGQVFPTENGVIAQAVLERTPVRWQLPAPDEAEGAPPLELADLLHPRQAFVVPLVAQDQAIAALAVFDKGNDQPFGEEDEQLLLALAGQAAVALQNARLYTTTDQALAARVEELSILQRIDRELNARLDVRRAMQVALAWAARRSGSAAGLMGLVQNDELILFADRGYDRGELGLYRGGGIPLDDYPSLRRAVETGQLQCTRSDQPDARFLRRGTRFQAVAPIEREEEVIGLLLLESQEPVLCAEETVHFLIRLADHAAIAVANAQLYAAVQRANETKSEFVSFVAHELKTPMTSIRGYADLLAKGAVGPINEHQAQFLQVIRSNVERMARLVADLSDISRIEAGKLELNFRKVDFRAVVEEVVRSLQQQVEAKNQTLTVAMPDDLPPVWGDRVRLAQILTNLVSNAHKYTPAGGHIRVEVSVEANPQPGGPAQVLHVAVADDGLGISEEDQRKIFQKFFRSEDRQAREAPGTGLGLHITKNLVELHGGQIWFESQLGQGTTFHFTVPVAD